MRLFNKRKNSKKKNEIKEKEGQAALNNNKSHLKEETIECYDAYGRKMLISKTEWLNKVLPEQIKKHWNQTTELYNDILFAVKDGFAEYVIDAAQHLKEIDDIKERGYVILSIVYMKVDKNSKAQSVLEDYINIFGKTGTILTNLAKTYEAQGKHQECLDTLWEGLQLEPNQENGLAWWLAIKKEEGGTKAYLKALNEAASIQGSYLPQMYIARNCIQNKDLNTALKMYTQLLEKHGREDDLLFMISGDMGQAGLVKEMLDLVSPIYDVNQNNERIGFNLLQGYLATKNIQEGQKLISQLMQLNRPDIKQYLLNMSNKFEEFEQCEEKHDIDGTPQIEICSLYKPVWHYGLDDVKNFKTPDKDESAVKVGILVYTNSDGAGSGEPHSEKETSMGRLTRSLALFISELFYYYTEYTSITLVPVMQGVGPVLSGREWSDDMISQMARTSELSWLVTGNVSMTDDKFSIETKLINVLDDKTELIKETMDKRNMGTPLKEHVFKIFNYITQVYVENQKCDEYGIPDAENLFEYLNSLGQSLTQTLVVNGITPFEKMYGERNILNGYIMCCLHLPSIPQLPAILTAGLAKSKQYGSNIYDEFKEQAINLVNDYKKHGKLDGEIEEMIKNL